MVEPKKLTPPKAKTGLVYNGQLQTGVPEGADYTLRNATGVDADDYFTTVEVKDKANTYWEDDSEDNTVAYRTSCRVEWSIAPRSASDVSATVPGSYVYNGSAQTPKPTVTWNGEALDSDDYTVSYANNVNAGTATVTITCEDGNFKGTKTASFSITPALIEGATVTLGDALTYTGKEQTQKVASVLVGGVDVKDFCDVSGNVVTDAGDYKLTITAKSGCNYQGSVTYPFSVKKAASSVGTVTAADVKDSLDPADGTRTRSDTSIPGSLAITDSQLSYGTNTYHWTFTPTDVNHESSSGTVEITVTGHEWGAPTYEWAEGNASCTAKRVCANNPAHVEEETVIPERKVTAEPTTDVEGKATLTATFQNSAFEAQSKEVSLPKLLGPGRIGSSVTTRGDGSAVQMSVPDGLLESMLTDDEKKLVAGGADASLVATVSWLSVGEAPKDDLELLANDCKDRKTSLGWEAYLDVALHVRIGDEERSLTKTDKPIAFEVKLDPEGKDPISKEYAQAVADGKVEGSVTVRRVHDGTVSEVGSAKKGETITFASDQFSTFALGSAAKEDASPTYGGPKAGGDSTGSPVQSSPSTATSSSSIGSSTTTRLANTSDNTSSVVPAAIAGAIALALAALKRKIHNR